MSEKTADERRFRLALGAITLAGLALRVANVVLLRPTRDAGGDGYVLAGDSLYYHFQANALAKGLGYIIPLGTDLRPVTAGSDLITPSAAHPPLYSTYLALWSELGVDTVTGHRLASCLVGAATVALVGLLAHRLAPTATATRVGLGAAAVAALYPGLWINDGVLLSETVAIFTVTLAVLVAYLFWERPSWWRALALGATIGLAALSRSEAIALVVFVALPLALCSRGSWGRRLGLAAVSGAAMVVVLAPWLGHNLTRFENPVLLTSSSGAVLSGASCDGSWYGPLTGSYADCFDPTTLSAETQADLCDRIDRPADCLATEEGVQAVVLSLRDPRLYDESQSDQPYAEQATAYIRDHLGRLPVVVAARVGRVWGVYAPLQNTRLDIDVENRGRVASWLGFVAYWLLVPLAVVGLWSLRRRRVPILPFLAVALTVTLAAGATFGVTRYRATAEALLVVAAALGVDAVVRRTAVTRTSSPAADAPSPPSSAG